MDNDPNNELKKFLDISGADKQIRFSDGTSGFLAQRFRKFERNGYDDFTLRNSRPNCKYKTEVEKIQIAHREGRMIANFYAYGHLNRKETRFLRFRILNFPKFVYYWLDKEMLLPDGPIPNTDGTTFLAWPFKNIPRELIIYELRYPRMPTGTLDDWIPEEYT